MPSLCKSSYSGTVDRRVGIVEVGAGLRGLVAEVFAVELVAVDVVDPSVDRCRRLDLVGDVDLGSRRPASVAGIGAAPAACPTRRARSAPRSGSLIVAVEGDRVAGEDREPDAGASQAALAQVAEIAVGWLPGPLADPMSWTSLA